MATQAVQKGPMQLTNQDFAEVVEALRGSGQSEGSERRQSTRVSIQTAVFAAPLVGGRPGNVRTMLTRDVSLTGIGLVQSVPVSETDTFIVKLPKSSKKA